MHDLNEDRSYDADWQRLRSLTRLSNLAYILLIPVLIVIGAVANHFRLSDYLTMMLIGIWILTFLFLTIRRRIFRCPRCSKPFFNRSIFYNDWARKCLNCGLLKYAKRI